MQQLSIYSEIFSSYYLIELYLSIVRLKLSWTIPRFSDFYNVPKKFKLFTNGEISLNRDTMIDDAT